jgi:hypothetical protein
LESSPTRVKDRGSLGLTACRTEQVQCHLSQQISSPFRTTPFWSAQSNKRTKLQRTLWCEETSTLAYLCTLPDLRLDLYSKKIHPEGGTISEHSKTSVYQTLAHRYSPVVIIEANAGIDIITLEIGIQKLPNDKILGGLRKATETRLLYKLLYGRQCSQ